MLWLAQKKCPKISPSSRFFFVIPVFIQLIYPVNSVKLLTGKAELTVCAPPETCLD